MTKKEFEQKRTALETLKRTEALRLASEVSAAADESSATINGIVKARMIKIRKIEEELRKLAKAFYQI